MLSLAFDPGYSRTNNYFYVYYTPKGTATTRAYNVVVRVATNGNSIIPGRGKLSLRLDPLGACDHDGGAVHFGKDNKLYITVANNGINIAAQSLGGLYGKMLRINPTGTSLRTIRSATAPRIRTRRSGYWDCAPLTPSTFNPAQGVFSSTTWAGRPTRRLTTERARRTMNCPYMRGAGKRPQILRTSPLLCSRFFLDHGMRDLQFREHSILARVRR